MIHAEYLYWICFGYARTRYPQSQWQPDGTVVVYCNPASDVVDLHYESPTFKSVDQALNWLTEQEWPNVEDRVGHTGLYIRQGMTFATIPMENILHLLTTDL